MVEERAHGLRDARRIGRVERGQRRRELDQDQLAVPLFEIGPLVGEAVQVVGHRVLSGEVGVLPDEEGVAQGERMLPRAPLLERSEAVSLDDPLLRGQALPEIARIDRRRIRLADGPDLVIRRLFPDQDAVAEGVAQGG